MIIIVDRFVEGHLHVLANVNTIKILNLAYPDQKKIFVAEDSHTELVAKYFETDEIKDVEFEPYKNKKYLNPGKLKQGIRVLNRLKNDILYFYSLFKTVSKNENPFVFITHVYPLSLVFVKLTKLFFPKVKLIITIHGEVEYLFYGKTRYEKVVGMLYGLAFKLKTANTCYLFLTKVSKKILVESRKLSPKEIISIILPAVPDFKLIDSVSNCDNDILKIGHIGSAGKRKNTQHLYEIAAGFNTDIKKNKVSFSVIGPIEENLRPYLNNCVVDFVSGRTNYHLDRNVYNSETKKIDYSIFFYGENDFVLRSSAAFFDAIYFEKPMIVLRNDFFESIFEEAGDIGYLCNTLSEMRDLIKKMILDRPTLEYQRQLQNVINYKNKLDLQTIADDMTTQIKNIRFNLKEL